VWGATIWALPANTDLAPGAFVFSTEGAFAGVITGEQSASGLVPADVLREWIGRLRSGGVTQYGELGVSVQPAPAEAVAGTGSKAGLVVTRVDPRGAAAGLLRATDLILSIAGAPASSREWQARTLRLTVGESIDLLVSRNGNLETLNLTAAGPLADADPPVLGLTMRAVPRVGVEVVQVESGSLGAKSGLEPGDLITVLGGQPVASAADVRRMFAAAPPDRPVLLAVTRGTAHEILVVDKP
jgi:S1-C subfamily serine protease